MTFNRVKQYPRLLLLAGGLFILSATGCSFQSTVGGQTLPSHSYLKDDVQFFPTGGEEQLPNLRRALDEYRLERESIRAGLRDEGT